MGIGDLYQTASNNVLKRKGKKKKDSSISGRMFFAGWVVAGGTLLEKVWRNQCSSSCFAGLADLDGCLRNKCGLSG